MCGGIGLGGVSRRAPSVAARDDGGPREMHDACAAGPSEGDARWREGGDHGVQSFFVRSAHDGADRISISDVNFLRDAVHPRSHTHSHIEARKCSAPSS